MLLDEATSNLDKKTDELIQMAIKNNFSDRTVITIAHRLNTVAEYDKIVVFDAGTIQESGHPFELLQTQSAFREMAEVSANHFD